MNTEQKIFFHSNGIVLGNLWGGGQGGYRAKILQADTKEALIEEAKIKLADGSLDGGMGFESLIGAKLSIKKITTIIVDGKEFTNKEYITEFIGNLNEEQIMFLEEVDF